MMSLRHQTMAAAALLLLTAAAPAARAQGQGERTAPALPLLPGDPDAPAETEAAPDGNALLEERVRELGEQLRLAEEQRLRGAPALTWNGYVDFGFFVPIGNEGVGFVRDFGNAQFPQYAPGMPNGYSWTFLGDILSTAVNTRGEVADLGSPPAITRFDSVDSDGAPGFIVNEVNLRPRYALSDAAILRASVNFVPRSGQDFALGDFVDVDLAEMEYLLTADGKTSIFAGKTLPVFGIEYKDRKSDQRFGITPSLVGRYTIGSQLGLKIRSRLLRDWLLLAASVTNNSSTIEMFHFASEIDKNAGKTLNGRAAVSVPIGELVHFGDDRLEIGVSGEWGSQDRASNDAGTIWFAGVDLQLLGTNYAVKAQALRGKAPGRPEEGVWGLDLHTSGYVEVDWQALALLGLMVRAEARDALVTLGTERIYVTKQARLTGGLRLAINPHVIVKAEYLHNREYGGIAQFTNDVATGSLVLAF